MCILRAGRDFTLDVGMGVSTQPAALLGPGSGAPALLPGWHGKRPGLWGALAVLEGSCLVQGLRREEGVCVASGFLVREFR